MKKPSLICHLSQELLRVPWCFGIPPFKTWLAATTSNVEGSLDLNNLFQNNTLDFFFVRSNHISLLARRTREKSVPTDDGRTGTDAKSRVQIGIVVVRIELLDLDGVGKTKGPPRWPLLVC